ncbi:MAG: rubrerythrin family protein [Anaerolineaceae bacterium]|nr:rubrerythrin family protein [Anaerolineaceae bacterium]
MSKTTEDLLAAFAGEAQANRKYTAFAKKAEIDGHPQIARLFRAAAHAETVHALSHLRVLGGVKTTAENLEAAIAGENYEVVTMYPEFISNAEKEDHKRAINSFSDAMEVEKVHEEMYREALDMLQNGVKFEDFDYYVCPVCGYVHKRSAPEKCPVCGALGSKFEVIH